MRNKQYESSTVDQSLLEIVKIKRPSNVEQLVKLAQLEHHLTEQEIMKHVLDLHSQGKLILKEEYPIIPSTLKSYLLSAQALWFWIILALSAITTILVFTVPENIYPFIYARYVLGSIFVLLLPGYTLIKVLFPTKELDNIERAALSIGMSLALVPITGLLLNYTPWGISTTPIIISLLALTTTFATAAIVREHQAKTKSQ